MIRSSHQMWITDVKSVTFEIEDIISSPKSFIPLSSNHI